MQLFQHWPYLNILVHQCTPTQQLDGCLKPEYGGPQLLTFCSSASQLPLQSSLSRCKALQVILQNMAGMTEELAPQQIATQQVVAHPPNR